MTTTEDILAVLKPGERISYPTLLKRLEDGGHEPLGMNSALDDPRLVKRWRNGRPYSWMDVYDMKAKGPLYVERAVSGRVYDLEEESNG